MGFFAKTYRALASERSELYVSSRGVIYCSKRVAQLENGIPSPAAVWMGAAFVKKRPTGNKGRIARATEDGDEIQGA